MNFELSESHHLLVDTVRDFCEQEVRPHARSWDAEERFPKELVPKLGELGLLGILVPEQYGGAGMDVTSYSLAVEQCARVDGSLALTIASHNSLGVGHLLAFGSEEQKQRYLPRLSSGQWLAAWALTEPGAGSDAAALRTVALRDRSGWRLDGTKTFITQGSVAGLCVVLARTDRDSARPHDGITAFLVETSSQGYRPSRSLPKYGCRWSDTAEVHLEHCWVDDAQRLGNLGEGFRDTMKILSRGRIGIAAMALGLGRGALEMALSYATERRAFGQAIAQHQAIQWKLADARTQLDAAELLIRRASWLADQGRACDTEASIAKLFASEAATRVCNDAMQIHGGYGYTREYDIERHLRDVKLCEIGEGTSEIQRLVIARSLLSE